MIGRLFHTLTATLLYFCLATLIAEAIMFHHLWNRWKMDRAKLLQMVAVAQGVALPQTRATGEGRATKSDEQPSYEQILAARAARDLNLQLREQSLDNALGALRGEQQTLAQSQEQYTEQRREYEKQLRTLQDESLQAGREINRQTLESIKAKQAKELLMKMLRGNEINAVVLLLRDMADGKRAKIVAEFKTPEESDKIEEVLRLIRTGIPEAGLAKEAEKQLQGKQPAQP